MIKYLIRTIRSQEIVGTYKSESLARKAFTDLAQMSQHRDNGLHLIRLDPTVIEVIHPS